MPIYLVISSFVRWWFNPLSIFVACIFMGACIVIYNALSEATKNSVTFQSIIAEVRVVHLRNGATVTLDANTTIDVHYKKDACYISLVKGRAFFNIPADNKKPFWIQVNNVNVKPKDASFDARIGSRYSSISVLNGDLDIYNQELQPYAMYENRISPPVVVNEGEVLVEQQASSLLSLQKVDKESIGLWTKGYLSFRNVELREVIIDLNRYLDTPLKLNDPALGDITVTAVLNTSNTSTMIKKLSDLLSLSFIEAEDVILLMSRARVSSD